MDYDVNNIIGPTQELFVANLCAASEEDDDDAALGDSELTHSGGEFHTNPDIRNHSASL
jgi:hypothetical protein